jgi:WD40 repeat protein
VGVQLIDAKTGAVTALPNPGRPRAVIISPDQQRLIVSDTFANTYVLWDVTDRHRPRVTASMPNGHDTATVEAMAITANGPLLVSAGREGKLVLSAFDGPDSIHEIGEIDTAQRVQTRADSAALLAITISPDGRILAAAGEEGPIGLWDIADPSQPRQIGAPLRELQGQIYGIGILPDGLTLVAGGQDKSIAAWNLRPISELRHTAIATACRRAGTPITADTWTRLAPQLEYRDTCTS